MISGPNSLFCTHEDDHSSAEPRSKDRVSRCAARRTGFFGGTGYGPTYMIGSVTGTPGEVFDTKVYLDYRGSDGRKKNAWFHTFKTRGVGHYGDKLTLPEGDYLVETYRNVLVVNASSIDAVVLRRLGHDEAAAAEMKQRVY